MGQSGPHQLIPALLLLLMEISIPGSPLCPPRIQSLKIRITEQQQTNLQNPHKHSPKPKNSADPWKWVDNTSTHPLIGTPSRNIHVGFPRTYTGLNDSPFPRKNSAPSLTTTQNRCCRERTWNLSVGMKSCLP